jgi:hypothetical protein
MPSSMSVHNVGIVRVVEDQGIIGTTHIIHITLEVPLDKYTINKELNKYLTDNEKRDLCLGTLEETPSSTTQQER